MQAQNGRREELTRHSCRRTLEPVRSPCTMLRACRYDIPFATSTAVLRIASMRTGDSASLPGVGSSASCLSGDSSMTGSAGALCLKKLLMMASCKGKSHDFRVVFAAICTEA